MSNAGCFVLFSRLQRGSIALYLPAHHIEAHLEYFDAFSLLFLSHFKTGNNMNKIYIFIIYISLDFVKK